jgi:hypothetical protein
VATDVDRRAAAQSKMKPVSIGSHAQEDLVFRQQDQRIPRPE